MIGDAGFRKAVRLERAVGRMMMYLVAPIAERLEKGPTMWGQWGLSEEEIIQGVLVQHRDDVSQRGDVGPRFLSVYGEEFEVYGRRRGGCRMAKSSCPVSSGPCLEIRKVRGRRDPIWVCLG